MTTFATVIIPTLARRPAQLQRAIDSILNQEGGGGVPLVVVNGENPPAGVIDDLRRNPAVRFHLVDGAGVSLARLEGRKLVDTPYFGFLDDDDEYLPAALQIRREAIERSGADLLVTQGFRETGGELAPIFDSFDAPSEDLAMAILEENWLASAGGLYRTDTLAPALFDDLPNHLELTLLGFRIALQYRVVKHWEPTFIVHMGSPDQVSQSLTYLKTVPQVLAKMERMTGRRDLIHRLKRKRAAALHGSSMGNLAAGNPGQAWQDHIRSLILPDGIRYLSYTYHLVTAPLRG